MSPWGAGWLPRMGARLKGRVLGSWRPHQLYLCGAPRWLDGPPAWREAMDAFGAWCAAHEGQVCEISLPGHCVLTSVSPGDATVQAAREQALGHWAHYFDHDAQDVADNWVVRQVLQPELGLVCAVPKALLQALAEQAAQHAVQLRAVRPWWAAGLQQVLASLGRREGLPVTGVMRLAEPGLVTHIETMPHAGGVAVSRWWVEAAGAAQPACLASVLPAPAVLDGGVAPPWSVHLWSHPMLCDVLRGEASAWRVPT